MGFCYKTKCIAEYKLKIDDVVLRLRLDTRGKIISARMTDEIHTIDLAQCVTQQAAVDINGLKYRALAVFNDNPVDGGD
jgi:hypothetical protein